MPEQRVTLVDADDRSLGTMEKLAAHREGRLHRAFSVFVFDRAGRVRLVRDAGSVDVGVAGCPAAQRVPPGGGFVAGFPAHLHLKPGARRCAGIPRRDELGRGEAAGMPGRGPARVVVAAAAQSGLGVADCAGRAVNPDTSGSDFGAFAGPGEKISR